MIPLLRLRKRFSLSIPFQRIKMATSTSAILQNGDSCQSPPPPSPEAASELFLATRKKELANVAALLTAAGAGDRVRLTQETHLAAALYPHWPPSGSPARVGDTNHTRLSVLHQFASTFAPDTQSNVPHSVCGRIFAKRRAGKNLIFYSVRDETNSIQFVCSADRWAGDPALFSALHNALRRGDIVHAEGVLGRTRLGEFSVFVTQLTLLAPCWHMLPTEHAGVHNPVARYRQPYLTMLLEEGTRTTLRTRSTIVREIRDFFHRREFMEVETPMLHSIAGGAAAKPFVTTHNDLQQSMFLRVAPELDLKKLVIGGFERVFEIGKSFRNEAIDSTHHPEFTSCEAYWAYGSFEDVIAMTEALMAKVVRSVTGKEDLKVAFGTSGDESTMEIDFTPPFRRVSFIPALEKQTGEKFPSDLGTEEARAFVQALCNRHGIELSPPFTTARMLDKLASRLIEPSCINPTFLVDHPQVMSPLAKWHPEQPHRTQRFELFVAKHEVCNAYSELNHPVVQRERFGQQQKDRDSGDTESQQLDEGFCLALEYGLPPTTGWAVGIDRLCMYLTNSNNIREVIAFPANGATAQHEASNIRKISAFATATPQQSLEDDDVLSSTPSVEPSEDAPTMENGYESVEVDQSFTSMSDSATVIGLRVAEGAAFVRLDHTCFYPQGGGQPSDRGTLLTENGEFNVVKVVRNNGGVIEHQLEINDPESLPSEGSTVRLFVDASVRELHSRYHSAGHLLDVISAQLGYSWTPSSAKHFPGDAYVSYRLPEPIEKERCAELRSLLEKEANQAIIQHEEELTSEQFLTRQAAEERTGSPLSLPSSVRQGDAVRLITILGDSQPCMGTHVGRIGEIGTLQVTRCLLRRKKKENFLTLGYELM